MLNSLRVYMYVCMYVYTDHICIYVYLCNMYVYLCFIRHLCQHHGNDINS